MAGFGNLGNDNGDSSAGGDGLLAMSDDEPKYPLTPEERRLWDSPDRSLTFRGNLMRRKRLEAKANIQHEFMTGYSAGWHQAETQIKRLKEALDQAKSELEKLTKIPNPPSGSQPK